MKGLHESLTVVGIIAVVIAVGWGIKLGYCAIEETGYEAHEAKVANELAQAKIDAEELATKTEELKTATAQIEQLTKQLELAKTEHTALTPAFKALVDLKKDNDECEKKFGNSASEKCTYRNSWWSTHLLGVSNSEIAIKDSYNRVDLVKFEFVRDAKGDIVDFKLVVAQQAAQN